MPCAILWAIARVKAPMESPVWSLFGCDGVASDASVAEGRGHGQPRPDRDAMNERVQSRSVVVGTTLLTRTGALP